MPWRFHWLCKAPRWPPPLQFEPHSSLRTWTASCPTNVSGPSPGWPCVGLSPSRPQYRRLNALKPLMIGASSFWNSFSNLSKDRSAYAKILGRRLAHVRLRFFGQIFCRLQIEAKGNSYLFYPFLLGHFAHIWFTNCRQIVLKGRWVHAKDLGHKCAIWSRWSWSLGNFGAVHSFTLFDPVQQDLCANNFFGAGLAPFHSITNPDLWSQ